MSRIYEKFCELLSAHIEANEKWTPIQKAHELLDSVNENETWKQLYAAADALFTYIAELESAQRWVPVSERLPEKSGWYRVGAINVYGEGYTDEIYFDANNFKLPWQSCVRDNIYCWLDGVPELPTPPEVQE